MDTFSIGGVIGRTRRVFGLHPVGFLVVAVVVVFLPTWFGPVVAAPYLQELQGVEAAGRESTVMAFFHGFAIGALPGVVAYVGKTILLGTVVSAAWRDTQGGPASFGDGLRDGFACLLPNLAVTILVILGVAVGSVLLVIPGLMLAYMWLVAVPVTVAERPGILAACGRSRFLTSGYRWRLFGITLVYGFVTAFVVGFIGGFASSLASHGTDAGVILALRLVATGVATVFSIVTAAGLAALYIELRRAKDGYLSSDLVDAFT